MKEEAIVPVQFKASTRIWGGSLKVSRVEAELPQEEDVTQTFFAKPAEKPLKRKDRWEELNIGDVIHIDGGNWEILSLDGN